MDIYLKQRRGEDVSLLFEQYSYADELRVVKEEALNEGLSKGLSIGEKKGRAEGLSMGREEERLASAQRMKEERLANAKRMKADGVEPALIARYTGLSVDEIKRL
jgi:predicted transposase YdaD